MTRMQLRSPTPVARLGAAAAAAALVAAVLDAPAGSRAEDDLIVGRVGRVEKDTIVVDRGKKQGVKARMVFDVYSPAKAIRLPLTDDDVLVPYGVVARAVVIDVEANSCRARLVDDTRITGNKPRRVAGSDERGVKDGDLAYVNVLAKAKNIPPFVREISSSAKWAWWGQKVRLRVRYTNEPDDHIAFFWTAQAGKLDLARTAEPENVWYPPAEPGEHLITVRVLDSAGNETESRIKIESKGFRNDQDPLARKTFRFFRTLGDFKASVSGPSDVAFDAQNGMHVLDPAESRVVAMGPDSAGRTIAEYPGSFVRILVRDGFYYAIDGSERLIKKFRIQGSRSLSQPAAKVFGGHGEVNGKFEEPIDLAIDAEGDLYVLDRARACVQVFDANGRFLYSFGGPGKTSGFLADPVAIDVAPGPIVYVLDRGRQKVLVYEVPRFSREFDVGATTEDFRDLKRDPVSGHLFILEGTTASVRRFDPETGRMRTAFGARGEGVANFRDPKRLRVGKTQEVTIVDEGSLLRWDVAGATEQFVGRWGGYDLADDYRIAAGPTGEVASLNTSTGVVTRLDRFGWITGRFGGGDRVDRALDLCVDDANAVYVLDAGKGSVLRWDARGTFRGSFGKEGSGRTDFDEPKDIACFGGEVDRVAILQDRDTYNIGAWEFDGIHRQSFPVRGGIEDPLQLAVGRTGAYYVADEEGQIKVFHAFSGQLQRTFPMKLEEVSDMAASNTGHLFVCDYDDETVHIYEDQNLRVQAKLKGTELSQPYDLAVDDYGGLLIYDYGRERIVRFEAVE